MKKELTIRSIDALQPSANDRFVWDGSIRGFGIKITPSGRKVFMLVYRYPSGRAGKVRRFTIGTYGSITLDRARQIAEAKKGDLANGIDPMATLTAERTAAVAARKAPKRSVEHIAKEFVERYAKKRNRSWEETQRILNRHVVAAWGKRQIGTITRSEVNELLDEIEDQSGAPMATAVLAQLRKMFNWHATRDEAFNSPIVKGMARTSPKAMARDRILSDDEIRELWTALDATSAPYQQLVRFLLLTAQRRDEAALSTRKEFKDGIWTIPAERSKNKVPNVIPLSADAQAQLKDILKDKKPDHFVFTTTLKKPFSGFSKSKGRLDELMEAALRKQSGDPARKSKDKLLKPWRIHDLRRTAKTLMQRAGVRPDVSERVLGHVIPGVAGTYDRHGYVPEKTHALEALAAEIRRILEKKPTDNNVVPMKSGTKN